LPQDLYFPSSGRFKLLINLYGTWLASFKFGQVVPFRMKKSFNLLIFLALTSAVWGQTWPSGAIFVPESGLPGPEAGKLRLSIGGAMLRNDTWTDTRTRLGFAVGLGHGVGLSLSSGAREVRGCGAFQQGIEDSRLGLSFWPRISDRLSAGLNANFIVPTGFRKQESYYDGLHDTTGLLPTFSIGQTGGEVYSGLLMSLGPSADVNAFAAYFSTADRAEQAFRWGLGTRLAPLGPRWSAELSYGQSIVREGKYPDTEMFSAALAVRLPWGFTIVPGMTADLDNEPVYGGSLGLRFESRFPGGILPPRKAEIVEERLRLSGRVLVAPPLTALDLADRNQLWHSIQEELHGTFDEVLPLESLDLPGLPYDDRTAAALGASIRAIADAHPEAQWLLIARVVHEDVERRGGLRIPLVVSRPEWRAECRLQVRLVNLQTCAAHAEHIIDGVAVSHKPPLLPAVSAPENEVLSMAESRDLTFKAYREAGRVIARELPNAQ
jgi:hypothetical protein